MFNLSAKKIKFLPDTYDCFFILPNLQFILPEVEVMNNTAYITRRSAVKTLGTLGITSAFVSSKAFGQSKKADGFALIGASTLVRGCQNCS